MAKNNPTKRTTIDEQEVAKFSAIADEWWNESGKFKPLHKFNPVRVKFIRDTVLEHLNLQTLEGLSLLDVGCGGGLLSEPLARMGAEVTGIDASEKNINVASIHAQNEGLDIEYIHSSAEKLLRTPSTEHQTPNYEVVLAMEIIEHVTDVKEFIKACTALVKPGGLLFFATMNRTVKSYALAIVGAEYILRWLPKGTHDWNKFLKPSEIVLEAEKNAMKVQKVQGVTFNPLRTQWSLSSDTDINYMVVLEKSI